MSRYFKVICIVEMDDKIKDITEEEIKGALLDFGEYNDKIVSFEEEIKWTTDNLRKEK